MTTTPDSRIRADWTLPAETAAPVPPLQPIDTSTTTGKVRVMDASARGESVQQRAIAPFVNATNCDWAAHDGEWNWSVFDYRIARPPAPKTALQRARACRSGMTIVNSESPDGILCCLLADIDYAPVVEVLERRISWDAADLSALPKGRYRLVRDDA